MELNEPSEPSPPSKTIPCPPPDEELSDERMPREWMIQNRKRDDGND
jgi:hypothetical protein